MTTIRTFLVGQHFVPPAKVLQRALPRGARVRLIDASDNPYDANAIKVEVEARELSPKTLEELDFELIGYGTSAMEVLTAATPMALGHVAASGGKPMIKARGLIAGLIGNLEVRKFMLERGEDFPLLARVEFEGDYIIMRIGDQA